MITTAPMMEIPFIFLTSGHWCKPDITLNLLWYSSRKGRRLYIVGCGWKSRLLIISPLTLWCGRNSQVREELTTNLWDCKSLLLLSSLDIAALNEGLGCFAVWWASFLCNFVCSCRISKFLTSSDPTLTHKGQKEKLENSTAYHSLVLKLAR